MSKNITVFISSRFDEFKSIRNKISNEKFNVLADIGLTVNMLDQKNGTANSRFLNEKGPSCAQKDSLKYHK